MGHALFLLIATLASAVGGRDRSFGAPEGKGRVMSQVVHKVAIPGGSSPGDPSSKPQCQMTNLDYTQGVWLKRKNWRAAGEAAFKSLKSGGAEHADQGSVAEVLANYHCPRRSIYDVYRETWFCSRKQYGLGPLTRRFARTNSWKNWTQYASDTSHEDQRVVAYLGWQWQPKTCSLAAFNSPGFVSALGQRKIFMIGDSLSDQQFHALACAIGSSAKYSSSSSRIIGGLSYEVSITIIESWYSFSVLLG